MLSLINIRGERMRSAHLFMFLIAFSVPFFTTFKIGGSRVGTLNEIFPFIILIFLINLPDVLKINRLVATKSNTLKTLFIFFALGAFSIFREVNIAPGISQLINNIEFILIVYCFSYLITQKSIVTYIYWGLLSSFLFSIFIGTMQYLRHQSFYLYSIEELNANTITKNYTTDLFRVWGPFGNSLTFSLYLCVAGILLFYYFKNSRKQKLIACGIFLLTVYGITITVSRTALISYLVTIMFIEFLSTKGKNKYLILICVALIIILALLFATDLPFIKPLIERASSSSDDLKEGRVRLWDVGFKVWLENFFFGTGPGDLSGDLYSNGITRFQSAETLNTRGGHVESYYLTILYSYGFIPGIFFFSHVYYSFSESIKTFWVGVTDAEVTAGIPLFGALIAFCINNLTNPILISDPRIQILYALILGLIVYFKRVRDYKSILIKKVKL